jgi:flavin-dependent dehydrogenase
MDAGPSTSESADVIVIGGGPAGSATALRLARQGMHVIQLERRVFLAPHNDRLRSGEGLIPRAGRELAALGIDMASAPWVLSHVQQLRLAWPDGTRMRESITQYGGIVQIDRERFDYELFCAACRAGVDGREGWRARRFYRDSQGRVAGVLAQAPGGRALHAIRARVVIDAGGRNALAFREYNLRVPDPRGDFFAMAMFFDQVADLAPGVWEMHLFDPHQLTVVQLSQLAAGLVRCGLGTTQQAQRAGSRGPQAFFWERIQHSPELTRRLAHSRVIHRPFVRASIGYRVRQAVFDGLLLAGDAAGYLNPLFGDGIVRALWSARHAATTVAAGLRTGDLSRAGLQRYARLLVARDTIDWAVKGCILRLHSYPRMLSYIGRCDPIRRALLAALLRS